jgi:hypothetical protein
MIQLISEGSRGLLHERIKNTPLKMIISPETNRKGQKMKHYHAYASFDAALSLGRLVQDQSSMEK